MRDAPSLEGEGERIQRVQKHGAEIQKRGKWFNSIIVLVSKAWELWLAFTSNSQMYSIIVRQQIVGYESERESYEFLSKMHERKTAKMLKQQKNHIQHENF